MHDDFCHFESKSLYWSVFNMKWSFAVCFQQLPCFSISWQDNELWRSGKQGESVYVDCQFSMLWHMFIFTFGGFIELLKTRFLLSSWKTRSCVPVVLRARPREAGTPTEGLTCCLGCKYSSTRAAFFYGWRMTGGGESMIISLNFYLQRDVSHFLNRNFQFRTFPTLASISEMFHGKVFWAGFQSLFKIQF